MVNKGTMDVNSLPNTVTRQRRGCDLNPGPSAPESRTLTTRLPSHTGSRIEGRKCSVTYQLSEFVLDVLEDDVRRQVVVTRLRRREIVRRRAGRLAAASGVHKAAVRGRTQHGLGGPRRRQSRPPRNCHLRKAVAGRVYRRCTALNHLSKWCGCGVASADVDARHSRRRETVVSIAML